MSEYATISLPQHLEELKGFVLRVVQPGNRIADDFRSDRLTVTVDSNNRITNARVC